MQKLAYLLITLSLVAMLFYGCDERTSTEPSATAPDASLDFHGTRSRLTSTFDNDAEDWTLVGDAEDAIGIGGSFRVQPRFSPAGGNPGGAVYAIDRGRGMAWFWQAPPKFLGNRAGAYGGTLEYDLKIAGAGRLFYTADVILAGGGLTLVIQTSPSPGTDWTHYSVPFEEGVGWRVGDFLTGRAANEEDFRTVLRNLCVLRIRGEHRDAVNDVGYLDNVRILPRGQRR